MIEDKVLLKKKAIMIGGKGYFVIISDHAEMRGYQRGLSQREITSVIDKALENDVDMEVTEGEKFNVVDREKGITLGLVLDCTEDYNYCFTVLTAIDDEHEKKDYSVNYAV